MFVRNLRASSTIFHDSLNLSASQYFVLCVCMQDSSISDHISYFVRRESFSVRRCDVRIWSLFLEIVVFSFFSGMDFSLYVILHTSPLV